MPVSFDSRLQVPGHVVVREVEGESVLLNLESASYFGLDETSTRIWRSLSESTSIGEAHRALVGQFTVEPETLHRDLELFIDALCQRGLVEIVDAPPDSQPSGPGAAS